MIILCYMIGPCGHNQLSQFSHQFMYDGDLSCWSNSKNPSSSWSLKREREGIISFADSTPSCNKVRSMVHVILNEKTLEQKAFTGLFDGIRLISWAISKDFKFMFDCCSLRTNQIKIHENESTAHEKSRGQETYSSRTFLTSSMSIWP